MGVEQVGQADAAGLGGQAEQGAVGVERPALAGGVEVEAGLVRPVNQLAGDSPDARR